MIRPWMRRSESTSGRRSIRFSNSRPLRLLLGDPGGVGVEALEGGHELVHRRGPPARHPGMSRSDSRPARMPLPRLLDQDAGDCGARRGARLADRGAPRQAERLRDDRAVDALDPRHRLGLALDALAAVDDPQRPLEGHRPRHLPAGDAVHVGADRIGSSSSSPRSSGRSGRPRAGTGDRAAGAGPGSRRRYCRRTEDPARASGGLFHPAPILAGTEPSAGRPPLAGGRAGQRVESRCSRGLRRREVDGVRVPPQGRGRRDGVRERTRDDLPGGYFGPLCFWACSSPVGRHGRSTRNGP